MILGWLIMTFVSPAVEDMPDMWFERDGGQCMQDKGHDWAPEDHFRPLYHFEKG